MVERFPHLCSALAAAALLATAALPANANPPSFRAQIAPLLLKHCVACHGPKKAEGNYRLDSFQASLAGGDSADAGVKPGAPDDSEVWLRLTAEDESFRMPLDADPLPETDLALFKSWIEQGAPFDGADPAAPLAEIVAPPTHPDPPDTYHRALPITALAFDPAGKELLVGGYHEVTVWDPEQGKLLRRIPNMPQRIYGFAWEPSGKRLAVAGGAAGRQGEVRLWDAAGSKLETVVGSTWDVVLDVAFHPSGNQLAVAGADGRVCIYKLPGGKRLHAIESHSDWVTAVAYSPDGKQLATASRDKSAKVFKTETAEPVASFSDHQEIVLGVVFHPDGKQVFTSGGDRRVRLWNAADAKQAAEITGFGGEVYDLTLAAGQLFAPSADKQLRQIDLKTNKVSRSYPGHADWVLSAAAHPGSSLAASGDFTGTVRIWNTAEGKQVNQFVALPGFAGKQAQAE